MQQKPTSKICFVLCLALGAAFLSCGGSESAVEVHGESRTPESSPTIRQAQVTSKVSKPPLLSVVVIGDSLTVGSEIYGVSLTRSLLNAGVLDVIVSAENGRTTSEGVSKLEDSMVVDGVVVIALGTNDVAMADPNLFGTQIDRAVAAVRIIIPTFAGLCTPSNTTTYVWCFLPFLSDRKCGSDCILWAFKSAAIPWC